MSERLITLTAVRLLTRRRNYSDSDPVRFYCGQFSPDNSLRCTDELGHLGWCVNGDTSWSAGAWNVDHWADTFAGPPIDPEPTMDARDWVAVNDTQLAEPAEPKPAATRRQPKPARSRSTGYCSRCHIQHRSCSCPRSEKPDDSWTHHELKMAARQRGITYYYRFSKTELIRLLNDPRQTEPKPPKMSAQEWKSLKVTGWCDNCRDWRKHCACTVWCNSCKNVRTRCTCGNPKRTPSRPGSSQPRTAVSKYRGWCDCGGWRQTCGCPSSTTKTTPEAKPAPAQPVYRPAQSTSSRACEAPELDPISRMQDWLEDHPTMTRLAITALIWGASLGYCFAVAK